MVEYLSYPYCPKSLLTWSLSYGGSKIRGGQVPDEEKPTVKVTVSEQNEHEDTDYSQEPKYIRVDRVDIFVKLTGFNPEQLRIWFVISFYTP